MSDEKSVFSEEKEILLQIGDKIKELADCAQGKDKVILHTKLMLLCADVRSSVTVIKYNTVASATNKFCSTVCIRIKTSLEMLTAFCRSEPQFAAEAELLKAILELNEKLFFLTCPRD